MSRRVAIVTDTTACIPPQMAADYGIEMVPLDLIFGDKVYRDGVDISPAEFYERLRKADKLPTTSGSMPAPFLEAYCRASARASKILCITVPSKLSGMFNSARLAREMARTGLPNVTIELIDCATAAVGQGLVVLAAAREARQGKDLAEVAEKARSVMSRVYLYAILDTLRYLVKGGRVPRAAALAGSLLQIKPIFKVRDGEALPEVNVPTMNGALGHILKLMAGKVVKGQPLHVAVMHADAIDRANKLRDDIAKRFAPAEMFITEFTPVMGVHAGPGVVGVAFYSGD